MLMIYVPPALLSQPANWIAAQRWIIVGVGAGLPRRLHLAAFGEDLRGAWQRTRVYAEVSSGDP